MMRCEHGYNENMDRCPACQNKNPYEDTFFHGKYMYMIFVALLVGALIMGG